MKSAIPILSLCILAAATSGCSQIHGAFERIAAETQPTLVFPAGTKIEASGREYVAWGTGVCPTNEGAMGAIFGQPADAGKTGCIRIPKDAEFVDVFMASPAEGTFSERWTVLRDTRGLRMSLARPDGSLIALAPR